MKVDFEAKDVEGHATGFSGSGFLQRLLSKDSIQDSIAFIVNQATGEQRGRVVTEALIAAELADPEIREVYDRNPEAINQYFAQIDIRRLIELLGPDLDGGEDGQMSVDGRDVLAFGSGAVSALLGSKITDYLRNS